MTGGLPHHHVRYTFHILLCCKFCFDTWRNFQNIGLPIYLVKFISHFQQSVNISIHLPDILLAHRRTGVQKEYHSYINYFHNIKLIDRNQLILRGHWKYIIARSTLVEWILYICDSGLCLLLMLGSKHLCWMSFTGVFNFPIAITDDLFWIGPLWSIFNEISMKRQHFHSRLISKCRLQNGNHFVSSPMC